MSNKELSSELGKLRYRTHDGVGMTQEEVADLMKVSIISIRSWESGKFRPSVPNLQKLIEVYVREGAFSPGKEQEEIRIVWEKAQLVGLKIAFDEEWFAELQRKYLIPVTESDKPNEIPGKAEEPTPNANPIGDELPISRNEYSPQEKASSSQFDEVLGSSMLGVSNLSLEYQDQRRMLDKVYSIWIRGLLEKSLHNVVKIELELHQQPDVVKPSWRRHLLEVQQEEVTSSLHILDAYKNANEKLLILGEPGSGKTTLLLQLTKVLLERARRDITHPIPVIFHLASWREKRQPIAKWLVEELSTQYHIPPALSQQWIDKKQLLPLLDGLDEVGPAYYSSCVEALNAYLREHGLVPTVICSRLSEYLNQPERLLLQSAVIVQPLKEKQIDTYLQNARKQKIDIREVFSHDSVLRELARTPLMLRILTTAYENGTVGMVHTGSDLDIRQQAFATYILQMFKRRSSDVHYSPQQTIKYLHWLAQQLRQHNQNVFYVEFMQFDWLPVYPFRQLYPALAVGLVYGLLSSLGYSISYLPYFSFFQVILFFLLIAVFNTLLYGFPNGIIFGVLADDRREETQISLDQRRQSGIRQKVIALLGNRVIYGVLNGLLDGIFVGLIVSPVSGWICGLFSCLFCAALGKLDAEIKCAEHLKWSRRSMWQNAPKFLVGGLLVGLLYGLVTGRDYLFAPAKLLPSLLLGVAVGLLVGLVMSIRGGFTHKVPDTGKILKPNQGIRNSIRNSLFFGSFFGIAFGLLFGLIYGPVLFLILGEGYRRSFPANSGLVYGLSDGLIIAAFFWLVSGGIACIQHTLLRTMLWVHGSIPWNYPRFLDHTVDLALLHKLGGGYIFFHRLLQEYFETLDGNQMKVLLNHFNSREKF